MNERKSEVSDKDLVVYKVLRKRNWLVYETPYRHCRVIAPWLGRVLKADGKGFYVTSIRGPYSSIWGPCMYEICGGAIHGFTLFVAASDSCCSRHDNVIFEAIIPAGTSYCRGTNYEIAAREMKLKH